MKILYYNWGSNSNIDICQTFTNLNIEYDMWQHELSNYEHDVRFSENLQKKLEEKEYDCIFSFDYIPLLSYAAKKRGILYYAWIYDCPQFTLFSDSVYNSCNRIFFFDRVQYQYFVNRGVGNAFHLPLAVNVNKFKDLCSIPSENMDIHEKSNLDISYWHDVSFIGNLYNANMYNKIKYLPPYLKGYLDGLINSQFNIYGYNMFPELLTDGIVSELDKYISLDDSVEIRLPHSMIYENMLYDKIAEIERKEVLLRCVKYADVFLYTGSDASEILDIENSMHKIKVMPPVDYDTQLPEIYRHTKINLNITCRSITSGMPLRVLDIMGSGGFLLSNYQPELAEYFIPGEEVVLYESMSDMENKVKYYLSHDEERIAIAQKGCRKVREQFSYENMVRKMLKIEDLLQ